MTPKEQIEHLIDEHIVNSRKAKRNREILKARLIDGDTIQEIAEEFGMSKEQIFRIIHRYGDPILIKLSEMTGN